jgi:hypothetical protein
MSREDAIMPPADGRRNPAGSGSPPAPAPSAIYSAARTSFDPALMWITSTCLLHQRLGL